MASGREPATEAGATGPGVAPADRAAGEEALRRCAGDPAAFRTRIYGAEAHLQRGGRPFDDLLSLGDVDAALTGAGLRHPAVRVVRDGEVLPVGAFTRPGRTGRTRTDDLIDPGRALDLFAGGATLVLQSLQRWWPPVTRFCRHLELALGHPVQANAYLTPPGAAGLAPHHDTHDVFVLQVVGTKHWCLRMPAVEAPLPRYHPSDHEVAAAQPVTLEADLAPGDALYLPRGVIHSAAAQRGLSLHLTVGILAATAHDVVRRVLDRAADEVAFRRDLPAGYPFDPDLAREAVAGVLKELAAWLGDLDPAAVADDVSRGFLAGRRPLLDGHLLELTALDALDDATVVRRRPGTVCTAAVEPAGGSTAPTLALALGDRVVRLPAAVEPAVRLLLDGRPHRVGELADRLDAPSRRVLVRRLVREGTLVTGAGTDA